MLSTMQARYHEAIEDAMVHKGRMDVRISESGVGCVSGNDMQFLTALMKLSEQERLADVCEMR